MALRLHLRRGLRGLDLSGDRLDQMRLTDPLAIGGRVPRKDLAIVRSMSMNDTLVGTIPGRDTKA